MQLSLEFIEEKERNEAGRLPPWERLEEAARLAAAARLARLITRMLAGTPREGETADE